MGCLKKLTSLSLALAVLMIAAPLHADWNNDPTATSSIGFELLSSDDRSLNLSVSLDQIHHETLYLNGERFDKYTFNDEAPAGQEGWPDLPAVVRFVLLPPQSGVDLNITKLKTRTEYDVNPLPRQPLENDNILNENIREWAPNNSEDVFSDPASREYDGYWPPQTVKLGTPAIMRGYRIIPVIFHPLRYNASTRQLEVVENIEIELDFTSDLNRVNLITDPDRPKPSQSVYKIIQDLVVNPPNPGRDLPQNGSIAYVIGTGDRWDGVLEVLEPLIEWRRRMGWSVEVIRVNSPTNRNSVKDAIQEAYDEWEVPPEHVVLVGDANAPSQYVIAYWDVRVRANFPYESDHQYIELEGDDRLPEASIGRMVLDSENMLRGAVQKTIAYESTPFIGEGDDAGWQKRGACAAVDFQSGLSSIDMSRWVRDVLLQNDYESVTELYWTPQVRQPATRDWVFDAFEDGCSFFTFRGYLWMGRSPGRFTFNDVNALRNDQMLPFALIITCNTGDYGERISSPFYFSERFAYSANGGAIGAVGCAGATHTAYNNLYTGGVTRAIFADSITSTGWSHSRGLIDLYRNYVDRDDIDHEENGGMESWDCHYYIINLMGDPAVTLFTDVPRELVVDHDDMRAGDSRYTVNITYDDNEEAAAGVQVCLYKPDSFQLIGHTDENGSVQFALNPEEIEQDDEVQLTVTGYNLMTYLADLEVETAEFFLGASSWEVDDDEEGESAGDGDGVANPTETIELAVEIANLGGETPEGEVAAVLTPALPHLEVLADSAHFDEAPGDDTTLTANFVIEIGGAFRNGQDAIFDLAVSAGDASWNSSVALPIEGAELDIVDLEWDGDPLERASSADLIITLANFGEKTSPAITAEIISSTITVGSDGETTFDEIEAGEEGEANQALTISATPMHLNSSIADLELRIRADNGFEASIPFSFVVGLAGEGDAFGPDGYGYLCVDNTDDEVYFPPTYEWIEIDPNEEEGQGTDTELEDTGAERDESIAVDLPFAFQYYGEEYVEITICTNGWITMGDHHELITGRNRRIPGGMVAPAMICPFWDDLKTTHDGGIYYWFDEENHTFIVEWKNMERLAQGRGQTETFQAILYDPDHYPSFSGDGDILFQYLEVEDGRNAHFWDVPYATVGIGSPDLTTGIQYTYHNELSPGAAPLEPELAIKFTTMRSFSLGAAEGYVYDLATEEPIEGAIVQTSFGYTTTTNDTGYYHINDMLVVDELDTTYSFTVSKQFYNDSTITGTRIIEDSTLTRDFSLLHPEFGVDDSLIVDLELRPDSTREMSFPLVNSGNGTLTFNSEISFRAPDRDELFDLFMSVNVTETVVDTTEDGEPIIIGNPHIVGVVFTDSMFYVTGGGDEGDSINAQFYRFTRNGEFIDSLSQPWVDSWGMRGMAYDGEEFIYGCYRRSRDHDPFIYKFNLDAELVDSIPSPENAARTIAIDRETETFYICGLRTEIFAVDMEGNEIDDWNLGWDGERVKQNGLAWYPGQPDSLKLLIYGQLDNNPGFIAAFSPQTGELRRLAEVEEDASDRPLGIDVSGVWNNSVWTLITGIGNSDGDRFAVWELEPNTTWLEYSPLEGTLEAGQDTTITVVFSAGQRPHGSIYQVFLQYTHDAASNFNAELGIYEIPIIMRVDSTYFNDIVDEPVHSPDQFGLNQNYPNPFNPTTSISFGIETADRVQLTIWDITGRQVSILLDREMTAGKHEILFDGSKLPNGVYLYHLESGGRSDVRKMVLIK